MAKTTKQIRMLIGGTFEKLMKKIKDQFEKKHGFEPSSDQVLESIGRAVEDARLF